MFYVVKTLATTFSAGDGVNPLTASIERSFSLLSKLIAKDPNFLSENNKLHVCTS